MIPQIFLFFFIFIIIFFYQTSAYISCKETEMACPDNFTCSSDGQFCHKNGSFNLRAKWSIMGSHCSTRRPLFCGPDAYCLEYSRRCIPKQISMCEFYLDAIKTTHCKNSYLIENFETCKNHFLKRGNFSYHYDSIMECADQCLRTQISNAINTFGANCSFVEKRAVRTYSECHLECGSCSEPSTWIPVFENIKKWGDFSFEFGRDFAGKCNDEFLDIKDTCTVLKLKATAHRLIYTISKHLNVDTTDLFKNLMALKGYKNIDIDQLEYTMIILFAIIIILYVVVCISCIIICKKHMKKMMKKRKNVGNGYIGPRFKDNIAPPLPRVPPPRPISSRSNFGEENYGSISIGGGNSTV